MPGSQSYTFRIGEKRRKALERLTREAGQPSPSQFLSRVIDTLDQQVKGRFDVRDVTVTPGRSHE